MAKISFLIVNYFASGFIEPLVQSIFDFIKEFEIEILISDNSSDLNEKDRLDKIKIKYSGINIFYQQQNIGFVKANNYLFCRAEGEIIILLNPDTLLIDNSILKIIRLILDNPGISLAGPKLLNYDKTYQTSFFKFPTLSTLIKEHILLYKGNVYAYNTDINKVTDCDVVKGACMVFKKSLIEENKIFDEDYIMYSEETDFCMKLKRKNKRVVYFPETKILHYGEKSTSENNLTEYVLYNYYRSKFIFFAKYYNKKIFFTVRMILFFSLLEKSVLLYLFNKKRSAKLYFNVYLKLRKDVKNLSDM